MNDSSKVRENRLRRMAERQGLTLQKSRRRDQRAIDYGRMWLVDMNTNAMVAEFTPGYVPPGETILDEIEAWLTRGPKGLVNS